jgi:hypothetical protein
LFKHKFHFNGTLAQHKARWVIHGFSQQARVDYNDTFNPIVKPTMISTGLSITTSCS